MIGDMRAIHWFRSNLRLRDNYSAPVVDHAERRQMALARYQAARRKAPRQ